jgi:hypothetical protein
MTVPSAVTILTKPLPLFGRATIGVYFAELNGVEYIHSGTRDASVCGIEWSCGPRRWCHLPCLTTGKAGRSSVAGEEIAYLSVNSFHQVDERPSNLAPISDEPVCGVWVMVPTSMLRRGATASRCTIRMGMADASDARPAGIVRSWVFQV